tara:strand:+ start:199 stop:1098 length:900 start_codon:yes stop_codon:yes gene_type:complete
MANIGNIPTVTGWQGDLSTCSDASLFNFRNFISSVFVASPAGNSLVSQVPASANGAFATIKNFECGAGFLFFRSRGSTATFEIPHLELGNLTNNSKLVTTFYPTHFSIEEFGEFHITTKFNKSAPTYELVNGLKTIWFDGSSYVLSDGLGSNNNALKNNSVLPNAPYGQLVTSSSTIVISDFTGNSASMNGLYVEVGYANNKKLYRQASTGVHFYFFDGSSWNLTDTPVNTSGSACYIKGTADLTGKLDNSNGSNGRCTDGQVARVMDGGVDPRSLATEDELKLLSTEDKLKVLVTEED